MVLRVVMVVEGDGVVGVGEAGQLGGVARHETFPGNCTSHPHQTLARGAWLWVTDLGCDAIYTMTSDPETPGAWWHLGQAWQGVRRWGTTEVSPGCGPRHMALHPTRDLAVLLCEQESLVVLYRQALKYVVADMSRFTLQDQHGQWVSGASPGAGSVLGGG
mgnify:CR=1 FL=1